MTKIPAINHPAYDLLHALVTALATFYQLCERAGSDIEDDRVERKQRELLDLLIDTGCAYKVGLTYHITTAARDAIVPRAPHVGQMATPAYRGTPYMAPAWIVRRASRVAA